MENITLESAANLGPGERKKILDEVIAVEKSAWPEELQASQDKFAARLEAFAEGFFYAKVNGVIKGVSTSQVVTYDPTAQKTWDELTDRGFIKTTHNPQGNAIYVVSIGVALDAQGLGLGSKLLEAQKDLTRKLSKKYLFLGARIPGYDSYCNTHSNISVEEYLKLRDDKSESRDLEIRFYERRGLKVAKVIEGFEPDRESRDWGVVMLWENIS